MAINQLSLSFPEIRPLIVQRDGHVLEGVDNMGFGTDSQGIRYLLKDGNKFGVAEFFGAGLCAELNLPHGLPAIVDVPQYPNLGTPETHFGSVLLDDVYEFDQTSFIEWQAVCSKLTNSTMFSQMVAVDYAAGNDDRHAKNWLVCSTQNGALELVAIDHSRCFPVCNPPHHPLQHISKNTRSIYKHWKSMGIAFEKEAAWHTCSIISNLNQDWLSCVLAPTVDVWLTQEDLEKLCQWWQNSWKDHLIDAVLSLCSDGVWCNDDILFFSTKASSQ